MYDYSCYFFDPTESVFIFQGRLYLCIWAINNKKKTNIFPFTLLIWNEPNDKKV